MTKTSILPAIFATALTFALPPCVALAQDFPNQQLRFVTGFPPGSGADVVTRYTAEKIKETSGVQIIVENRVGAAGGLAMETVARSRPDGYTVLLATATATAAANHLYKERRYDVLEAFRIGATINRQGFMIVVDPSSPYKTLLELTAAMKLKGDKANYGTAAPTGIVLGEMYKTMAGLSAQQIRFRSGGDSLKEMASGAIDFGALDPQLSLAQLRQGKLRILAVGTGSRISALPDVPTMEEAGVKGVDLTGWWALIVPKATPDHVVNTMHGWMQKVLPRPEVIQFFKDAGADTFSLPPKEADALFVKEEAAWGRYAEIAKLEKQ